MSREAFEAWFADYLGPLTTKAEKHSMWAGWQAARAAALEEAAEACESEAENWRGEQSVIDFRLCAARIRALKEK